MIPVVLTRFEVGSDTYHIARLDASSSWLRLFQRQVDPFGNVSWASQDAAAVRTLFETMVFRDRKWSALWRKLQTRFMFGDALVLGGVEERNPLLLRAYEEEHGNHGRGGTTYEIDVYRPTWAVRVDNSESISVWAREGSARGEDILLRALLRLTEEPP